MKGDEFMDKDRQLLDEKSSDFDSVTTMPTPIPPTTPSSKNETKSCTNANTMPKPETTKDNSQYSDK